MDEKILAVPIDKITQINRNVRTYQDMPEIDLARIAHFFEHYKDLEPNKWVKVLGWEGPERGAPADPRGHRARQGQAGAARRIALTRPPARAQPVTRDLSSAAGRMDAVKRQIIPGVIDGEQALCCLPATATADEAAQLMRERRVGAIMIVEQGRLEGIVTERDLVFRLLADQRRPAATPSQPDHDLRSRDAAPGRQRVGRARQDARRPLPAPACGRWRNDRRDRLDPRPLRGGAQHARGGAAQRRDPDLRRAVRSRQRPESPASSPARPRPAPAP